MFIINHFLMYRINKLDHDFLNWQIFSVVCPLRNHMTPLLIPSVLKWTQSWQVGWIRSIAKNTVYPFFLFFCFSGQITKAYMNVKCRQLAFYFHVKKWKTELKTILKYLRSRVGIITPTGGSRTVVASKPNTSHCDLLWKFWWLRDCTGPGSQKAD